MMHIWNSIKNKMVTLTVSIAVGLSIIMLILVLISMQGISEITDKELKGTIEKEVEKIADSTTHLLTTSHEILMLKLFSDQKVLVSELSNKGGLNLGGSQVTWQAVNQYNQQSQSVTLPQLRVGQVWLGQISSSQQVVPIVDSIVKQVGGIVTIFQRMNQQGDMLRVATSVTNESNERAIGTYIPVRNPDGTSNKVLQKVLAGDTYTGRALVVGEWYLTSYHPIRDNTGTIIAIASLGLKQELVSSLRNSIMELNPGKTGYVYILGGHGDEKGRYIISNKGTRNGENIYNAKDADGRLFIKEIVDKAITLGDGETFIYQYPWKNEGETEARQKIAAIKYFAPWDWVIGASTYIDDYREVTQRVENSIMNFFWLFLIVSTIMLIVSTIVTYILGGRISRPIVSMVGVAKALTLGDLDQEVSAQTNDEVGELAEAFKSMIDNQQVIAGVANSIQQGKLDVDLEPRSDKDVLMIAFKQMVVGIKNISNDIDTITVSVQQGDLGVRGEAQRYSGNWAELVKGINGILDEIDRPFTMAIDNMERIGNGDIPDKITEEFYGDFNKIKDSLNNAIGALGTLKDELQDTISEQTKGEIDARTNPDNLQGIYAQLALGVNEVLDTVILPVLDGVAIMNEYAAGDLDSIMRDLPGKQQLLTDGLNNIRLNIKRLVDDVNALAETAQRGELSKRADESKHTGEYQNIVIGLNRTLDEVINPINEAARVLEDMSNYNLTTRMVGEYQGDHAKIKRSLNISADALHDAISQVAEAVDQVSSATEEIASSSQQVAEGSSEQASSLEETSSSLEEMSSMTKQNADNTQQARVLAESAKDSANTGSEMMGSMVTAMTDIKTAAEGTAQIIKDINEIAFQTNLLALNAAVEAARAGDAGRGFAVVAEEVRNLALRAKSAAQRTEELISESMSLSEQGSSISTQVNTSLSEIVDSIGKVTNIMAEISIASQEQARGIDQINTAIAQMDQVVQQSAANAEESSSASEELAGQAQELAVMVSRFKVSRAGNNRLMAKAKPQQLPAAKYATEKKKQGKPSKSETGIKVSPEDIIPLDDDPVFSDF